MSITGHSISQLSCESYLYIKPSERTGFIPISEYHSGIIEKNPKHKFTHQELSKCEFQYRGNPFQYSELCVVGLGEMTPPQFYNDDAMKAEFFDTTTQAKGYCLRLLKTLDRYLGKARFETIKAATILDVDYLNADTNIKPYSWQYFQRCYNAENAIYSYYSLYEIIVLLVYICAHQNSGLSFEEYSKKCRSAAFRKKIKQGDNELFILLSDGTSDANIHPDFEKVCSWCNSFKHRGVIRFDGEYMKNQVQTMFITVPGSGLDTYCSEKNEFVYIDLDNDVIPELMNYHQKIIDLAYKVIAHCKVKEIEL